MGFNILVSEGRHSSAIPPILAHHLLEGLMVFRVTDDELAFRLKITL